MPAEGRVDAVQRIVVLRPSALGDFVFALPCLHALRNAYPEARIVYVGRDWHRRFLSGRPGPVDEVQVLPPCAGVGATQTDEPALQRFLATLQSAPIDIALQLYGGGRFANPLARRFGARLCAGLKAADAPALDRQVAYGPLQNRRLQLLEVAALVGADPPPLDTRLTVTDADRREAQAVLADDGAPLALIQPGASDPRRCWPAKKFAAVADTLAARGLRVAVQGSDAERALVAAVIAQMRQPAMNLAGRLSLPGLCGVLARTRLLVSNDTGPLHLALAVGTPAVGIYWRSNLIESLPLHQHAHRAAWALRAQCPVCGRENLQARCAHEVSFVDEISVDEVLALSLDLLQQTH